MTFPSRLRALLLAPLFASLLCATAPVLAQQKLVAAGSEISFTSKQLGVPVDGRFQRFDAQVRFDPKQPEAASIAFTVDLGSVSMGAAEAEAELAKPGWFDSARTPKATFQSTAVKATGPGKFDVTGKLTIKGQTRDVVVPVAITQAGGSTTASGAFVLKRIDFRIGEGEWNDTSIVANDVQVRLKLNLSGVGPL